MVERILKATFRVLGEHGYDGASTHKIAQAAGVSVGSIYQYYPNKQSIVVAAVEDFVRSRRKAVRAKMRESMDEPTPIVVERIVRTMFAICEERAGLLKVLLAIKHDAIPPSINVRRLSPSVTWDQAPFFVPQEPVAWPRRSDRPRRAAVNAFGIGGLNVHVVVEEYLPEHAAPLLPPRAAEDADATPLEKVVRPPRLAILFGHEGEGLADEWIGHCDHRWTIPMANGTDSLNVAAAAAIVLHYLTRLAGSEGTP